MRFLTPSRRALRALLGTGLFLLAGCSRPLDPGLKLLRPDRGPAFEARQVISLERGGKVIQGLAMVSNDARATRLAVLTPQGQRLFSLSWDGDKAEEWRSPMLPAELPLALILRDLQFATWPAEAIEKSLPRGWSVKEDGPLRSIYKKKKEVLKIQRAPEKSWLSPMSFEHLGVGYLVRIHPVEEE